MSRAVVAEGLGLALEVGGRAIVDGANIEAKAGQVLGLLGPNGAGKSSLLDLLGLHRRPSRGEVRIDGERVDHLRGRRLLRARRKISRVFQDALLLDRSVAANVEIGLCFRGIRRGERAARARRAMELLGVAHLAQRRARTLSGGEAQRVSVARALAISPRLLLLDEPFSAVDGGSRRSLAADLKDLVEEAGIAAVMVTHDRTEALGLCPVTAIMLEGKVVQVGETSEVLARPVNETIARFLGFDNRIEGEVVSEHRGWCRVRVPGGMELELATEAPAKHVTLMFRAEDLRLRWEPVEAGKNRFRARVARIVPEGFPCRVLLDWEVPLVTVVPSRLVASRGLSVGRTVVVEVAPDEVRCFPR